jgi:hypothetical protein
MSRCRSGPGWDGISWVMAAFRAPMVVFTATLRSCSPWVPTSGDGDNILRSMVVLPSGGDESMIGNVSFGDGCGSLAGRRLYHNIVMQNGLDSLAEGRASSVRFLYLSSRAVLSCSIQSCMRARYRLRPMTTAGSIMH